MTLQDTSQVTQATERAFLRVREIRIAKGMTVQQIADVAGISYNTALAYDRDSAFMVRKDIMIRIADALGVKVGELFA